MKKLFLLLALLVLPFTKSLAQIEYPIHWNSLFIAWNVDDWYLADYNEDNNVWFFNVVDEVPYLTYKMEEGITADDKALSPSFMLYPGDKYTLYYNNKCTKGMEYSILLYDSYGNKPVSTKKICNEDDTDFKLDSISFTVDSADTYFLCIEVKDIPVQQGSIEMCKFYISYEARPELEISFVEDIYTSYRKKDPIMDINIANKGNGDAKKPICYYTINGGTPVYLEIQSRGLYNGENYRIQEPLNIGYGKYDLELVVKCEADTIATNDTLRCSFENREYTELPFYEDFEDIDYKMDVISTDRYFHSWQMEDSESDVALKSLKDWGNFLTCQSALSEEAEWIFMPPFKAEPGYYAIEFDYIDVNNVGIYMDLCYGNDASREGMVNRIGEITNMGMGKTHGFFPFYISETQDCVIGIHSLKTGSFYAVVDNISIKPIEKPADDLEMLYSRCDYDGAIREGFANKTIYSRVANNSIDKVITATVKTYIDENEIYNSTFDMEPISQTPIYFTHGYNDEMTPGRHIVTTTVYSDNDADPENNSIKFEVLKCSNPFLFHDFENGMPEGIELVVADEGTAEINPENSAWYIGDNYDFKFSSTKALSSSSKISGVATGADRWFIMSPVYVGNGGADIVWEDLVRIENKWDFDHLHEEYQILISTTDTSLESFKLLGEYKVSNEISQLRRIRLDEFAGNNVHIAFRLKSACGQSLFIDNIGLYGDFEDMHTSVDKVAENSINVTVKGDMINVSAETDRIDVIDIDGRIVATANNSSSLNIASLSSGVYMARVNVNGTVNTVKFVR